MTRVDKRLEIAGIAKAYFDYMAMNYPVMCLNDEFYFFPRAKKGVEFLGVLDSLDSQKIGQDTTHVRSLKDALQKLPTKDLDIESRIDLTMLSMSISTYLREFSEINIWQRDPSLYLKILLLGIDQLLTHFSFIRGDVGESIMARLSQAPRLLKEARHNIKRVSPGHREVALEMAHASIAYFENLDPAGFNVRLSSKETRRLLGKVIASLNDFNVFLKKIPTCTGFIRNRELLEKILNESFSYKRGLDEIYDIAYRQYLHTIRELKKISAKIDPAKNWQAILSEHGIKAKTTKELIRLYSYHIDRLRDFIKMKDLITIPRTQRILTRPTPDFMKPVRASASYNSPVTNLKKEPAYFYITTEREDLRNLKQGHISSIHNEYIFVTAHETYPGHHLLDLVRRNLKNPIRAQIESPLFYEGWASYSERLIAESGYIKDPLEQLIGLKRQAWRAIRAMLDVGIRIKRLKKEEAATMLGALGYAPNIVRSMLRHYLLSPGYQLCYTIGKFEIERIRKKFHKSLGLKRVHDLLLGSGQIPFDLIEERMQAKL